MPDPIPVVDDLILDCVGSIYLFMLYNSLKVAKIASHGRIDLESKIQDMSDVPDTIVKDMTVAIGKQAIKKAKESSNRKDQQFNKDDMDYFK